MHVFFCSVCTVILFWNFNQFEKYIQWKYIYRLSTAWRSQWTVQLCLDTFCVSDLIKDSSWRPFSSLQRRSQGTALGSTVNVPVRVSVFRTCVPECFVHICWSRLLLSIYDRVGRKSCIFFLLNVVGCAQVCFDWNLILTFILVQSNQTTVISLPFLCSNRKSLNSLTIKLWYACATSHSKCDISALIHVHFHISLRLKRDLGDLCSPLEDKDTSILIILTSAMAFL